MFAGPIISTCYALLQQQFDEVTGEPVEDATESFVLEALHCVGEVAISSCSSGHGEKSPILIEGYRRIHPFIICGIRSDSEEVFTAAIGVFEDFAAVINEDEVQEVMQLLVDVLRSDDVLRDLKPKIFKTLSFIALDHSVGFAPFRDTLVAHAAEASALVSEADFNGDDEDIVDFFFNLYEAIFTFFTGVLQGHKSDPQPLLVKSNGNNDGVPLLEHIVRCTTMLGEKVVRGGSITTPDSVAEALFGTILDIGNVLNQTKSSLGKDDRRHWQTLVLTDQLQSLLPKAPSALPSQLLEMSQMAFDELMIFSR